MCMCYAYTRKDYVCLLSSDTSTHDGVQAAGPTGMSTLVASTGLNPAIRNRLAENGFVRANSFKDYGPEGLAKATCLTRP